METVLIVVDDIAKREYLKKILKNAYVLIEPSVIENAVDFLKQKIADVSIVILGLENVEKEFDFLNKKNKEKNLKTIPVLMISTNISSEYEIKFLKTGILDFANYSTTPEIIIHRIGTLIKLKNSNNLISKIKKDFSSSLYTREYFFTQAKKFQNTYKNDQLDILSIEIENFKLMATKFSGTFENKLLEAVGKEIKNKFENTNFGIAGYFSEGNFGILTKKLNNYREIFDSITKNLAKSLETISVIFKIGIYTLQFEETDIQNAYHKANVAKDRIKDNFNQNFCIFDEIILKEMTKEQQIVGLMESAIEEKQFKVYLQPKFDSRTNTIMGAEALARWIHPEMGFISPSDFIPIFEKKGFIPKLDYYILEEVCHFIKKIITKKITPVPISVNFSRIDINQEGLTDKIVSIADKYGIPHTLIHIEITESAYIDNTKKLVEIITSIKEQRFEIELDDFGTGFSSLNMINELPIKYLKLDMSFVQKELSDTNNRKIISFIISLAKWLNLHVIAEGVETKEQVDKLKEMDAYYIQGYFYSKPLPENEFLNLLEEKGSSIPLPIRNSKKNLNFQVKKEGMPYLLLVDDVEMNRAILKNIFEKEFNIVEASNGKIALEYLKDTKDKIELILLDLVMPIMDGFKFMEIIKKDEKLKEIPVIITSQNTEHSENRAIKLGAEAFLAKPYNPNIIMHNVKSIIEAVKLRKEKFQIQENQKLLKEAFEDYLTGTLNSRGMEKAWKEMPYTCNGFFALYLLDIDDFKKYNDMKGHKQGDEILVEFINELIKITRNKCLISRRGGDEFLILAKDLNSPEEAWEMGNHFCQNTLIDCSIGVTVFKIKPSNMEEVERIADKAMYKAKENGKKQCALL